MNICSILFKFEVFYYHMRFITNVRFIINMRFITNMRFIIIIQGFS